MFLYFAYAKIRSSRSQKVLQKNWSEKFCKILKKKYAPESVFNKVTGLQLTTSLKRRPGHIYFHVSFAAFLYKPFLQKYHQKIASARYYFEHEAEAATGGVL